MIESVLDIRCIYDIQGDKLTRRKITKRDLEFQRVYLAEDKKHFGYWLRADSVNLSHGCYFSSRKLAIEAIKERLQEELNSQKKELKELQKRNKILVANLQRWDKLQHETR